MPFNLITDPWLPVRRLSGGRSWIAPAQITIAFADDPILALDFPRPDWNAAVTELLIGLLATVMAPRDTRDWADAWAAPPTPEISASSSPRIAFAFNLDGDGPRCFQDIDPLAGSEAKPISALLIDAPGENAEKKNTDLFVKRVRTRRRLCPAYAAAALITLQTYAPAGGQGNRTSMRGGGPLDHACRCRAARSMAAQRAPLSRRCGTWSGRACRDRDFDRRAIPDTPDAAEWAHVFPWLAPTRTSEKDRGTLPDDGHISAAVLRHAAPYPARLRAAAQDRCALTGRRGDTSWCDRSGRRTTA